MLPTLAPSQPVWHSPLRGLSANGIACVEILLHMDMMMILSDLVRDMEMAELELGEL